MAGKKGRSGRKPNALTRGFREFCRDVVAREDVRAGIERACIEDPKFAMQVAEQAHGRPPQALDVSHKQSGPLEFRILDATGASFAFGGGDLPTRSIPLPTEASE